MTSGDGRRASLVVHDDDGELHQNPPTEHSRGIFFGCERNGEESREGRNLQQVAGEAQKKSGGLRRCEKRPQSSDLNWVRHSARRSSAAACRWNAVQLKTLFPIFRTPDNGPISHTPPATRHPAPPPKSRRVAAACAENARPHAERAGHGGRLEHAAQRGVPPPSPSFRG